MLDIPKLLNEKRQLIEYFKRVHFSVILKKGCVDSQGNRIKSKQENTSYFQKNEHSIFLDLQNEKVQFRTPFLFSELSILQYLAAEQAVFLRKMGKPFYLDTQAKSGCWEFQVKLNSFFQSELEIENKDILLELSQTLVDRLYLLIPMLGPIFKQNLEIKFEKETKVFSFSNLELSQETDQSLTSEHLMSLKLLFLYAFYALNEEKKVANVFELSKELSVMLAQINGNSPELELVESLTKVKTLTFPTKSSIEKNQEYHDYIWDNPFQLPGFEEMELSTQLMLASAIEKGINFEILDSNDQFVKLYYQNHVEYVKNTNMTSLDSYVSPLIMENKTVTKNILNENGFRVPMGQEYSSFSIAEASYIEFCHQKIVVKPKSTNFGLGISIFEEGFTQVDFNEAIRIAFEEDEHILIEEFISGTEYRFYVLDGEVEGIILRVPANIKGDGIRTVEELVNQKNQDPLRGTHYRRPLQLIKLNDVEKLMLKTQGMTIHSIPTEGQVIYLRENSNVSTGGDSIDMTDDMDESYKKIAADAVQSLGAFVSGIDLMIEDHHRPANQISLDYGIIEANFNPAIHMHMYPFKGKGRPLASKMLEKLFPEIKETSK
ncbi:bifunctional glutamate--cysteine ligase GshA/glutathione synthetase GshB [Vagococcus sp.]|uniref:bifunctional glutamate--cysteine ligase GshA/glutathione synthetase GshB n=1 Tax=Vagococcus sp. TaxID=1933889 RepID=UPI003F946DEF